MTVFVDVLEQTCWILTTTSVWYTVQDPAEVVKDPVGKDVLLETELAEDPLLLFVLLESELVVKLLLDDTLVNEPLEDAESEVGELVEDRELERLGRLVRE